MRFSLWLGLCFTLCFTVARADAEWFWTWEHPPGLVTQSQWGSRAQLLPSRLRHRPKRIVVHHAGVAWKPGTDPADKVRRLQAWGQREKSWPDLPYHYLITPDGQLFEGRDWRYRPESNTDYELDGVLNVQLFGDFQVEEPTTEQLETLLGILTFLCRQHSISPQKIYGHREAAPAQTTCPGDNLQRDWTPLVERRLRSI